MFVPLVCRTIHWPVPSDAIPELVVNSTVHSTTVGQPCGQQEKGKVSEAHGHEHGGTTH